MAPGGQAGTSARIENYLGFPAGMSGSELAQRAGLQALQVRRAPEVPAEAVSADQRGRPHAIELSDGEVVDGAHRRGRHRRPVPAPRRAAASSEFEGGGVYYAATQAEAQLCEDDPVWSSAAATRPARRRCSCPQRSARVVS